MAFPARALHYVFKIGNRATNIKFFRSVLGMKILRHEEFKTGCEAQCNGPYDNRWSKTMVGYGAEYSHFAMELTYNYGVKSYQMGNDFGGITIKSQEVLQRACAVNYPIRQVERFNVLVSPDGYQFNIIDEPQPTDRDPVFSVTLSSSNMQLSKAYWHQVLGMAIVSEDCCNVVMAYSESQTFLHLREVSSVQRADAYGRIAFAVPASVQEMISVAVTRANVTILKPLMVLDTPGKASVRVIILADPDGHEICFVDEEGFSQLSQVDPGSAAALDTYITKDPFQNK